jgi:hypothetical protein
MTKKAFEALARELRATLLAGSDGDRVELTSGEIPELPNTELEAELEPIEPPSP